MNLQARNEAERIPADERLIFALDQVTEKEARGLIRELKAEVKFFKIGLELFLAGGWPVVEQISGQGGGVFLDLKFYDIPETVYRSLKVIEKVMMASSNKNVFATIHAFNNAFSIIKRGLDPRLKILVVTALTSIDDAYLKSLGSEKTVAGIVNESAAIAKAAGCHGIICSGFEAFDIKKEFGNDFLVVTPGIRPAGTLVVNDDQKRIVTPRFAIMQGADYIVVGRPIRDSRSPVQTAKAIQAEIREALDENLRLESEGHSGTRLVVERAKARAIS